MKSTEYYGHENVSYGLYDTLIVSISRIDEFKQLLTEEYPNFDERPRIIGSMCVSHSDAFYCDEYGAVTKWSIEGGD